MAFVCGIASDLPGLSAAYNPNLDVPKSAAYLYSQIWLVSTCIAGAVYWTLRKLSPMPVDAKYEDVSEGMESD